MKSATILIAILVPLWSPSQLVHAQGDTELRDRLVDKNGAGTDIWVYNDIEAATKRAREENKPLFVTFRCVPCQACAAFDAEVADGNELVKSLAREKFISVRQVEMKHVDLSLFEFDHDLNWAAMFVHPDGTVYARYGTQSAAGPDAYNSIDGLLNTMNRVLQLHKDYPGNKSELQGKRGNKPPGTLALGMPGMQNAKKLEQQTTRSNCIHCHMIHDAQHFEAQKTGSFQRDSLWKFPLPDRLGIVVDADHGIRVAHVQNKTPAAAAGLRPGDEILRMNGQRMTSVADMQWVLHQLPNQDVVVEIDTKRNLTARVQLKQGWKEHDISWRGSMWSVSPRLRVWAPSLGDQQRRDLGIGDDQAALLVRWINRGEPGGRAAFAGGLRQGDIIVGLAGKPLPPMTPQQFNMQIKLNYRVGEELRLSILRNGQNREIRIKLVE